MALRYIFLAAPLWSGLPAVPLWSLDFEVHRPTNWYAVDLMPPE